MTETMSQLAGKLAVSERHYVPRVTCQRRSINFDRDHHPTMISAPLSLTQRHVESFELPAARVDCDTILLRVWLAVIRAAK